MDVMFTRWDPVAHLESEAAQIEYLKIFLDECCGDGAALWAALQDIARAPLAGPFSWSVRTLLDHLRAGGDPLDPGKLVDSIAEACKPYVVVSRR